MDRNRRRVWTNVFHLLPWLSLAACLTIGLWSHPVEQAVRALARPTFLIGILALFYRIVAHGPLGPDFRSRMARIAVVSAENFIALISVEDALFAASPALKAATAWVTLTTMVVSALVLHAMAKRETANASSAPRDDASSWILGVFYRNAADRSLWVPKRTGLGYTLNLARWQAWAVLGLFGAVVVISAMPGP
jgi:hypothetical protein